MRKAVHRIHPVFRERGVPARHPSAWSARASTIPRPSYSAPHCQSSLSPHSVTSPRILRPRAPFALTSLTMSLSCAVVSRTQMLGRGRPRTASGSCPTDPALSAHPTRGVVTVDGERAFASQLARYLTTAHFQLSDLDTQGRDARPPQPGHCEGRPLVLQLTVFIHSTGVTIIRPKE